MGQTRLLGAVALGATAAATLLWRRWMRFQRTEAVDPAPPTLTASPPLLDLDEDFDAVPVPSEAEQPAPIETVIDADVDNSELEHLAPIEAVIDADVDNSELEQLAPIRTDLEADLSPFEVNLAAGLFGSPIDADTGAAASSSTLSAALERPTQFIMICARRHVMSVIYVIIHPHMPAAFVAPLARLSLQSASRDLFSDAGLIDTDISLTLSGASSSSTSSTLSATAFESPTQFILICVRRQVASVLLRMRIVRSLQFTHQVQHISMIVHPQMAQLIASLARSSRITLTILQDETAGSQMASLTEHADLDAEPAASHPSSSSSSSALSAALELPARFIILCARKHAESELVIMRPPTDELPVEQEVEQDNNPNHFAEMFLRAAAQYVQEMSESCSSTADSATGQVGAVSSSVEGGPITFAPHHLLDPLLRQLRYGATASMSGSSTSTIGSESSNCKGKGKAEPSSQGVDGRGGSYFGANHSPSKERKLLLQPPRQPLLKGLQSSTSASSSSSAAQIPPFFVPSIKDEQGHKAKGKELMIDADISHSSLAVERELHKWVPDADDDINNGLECLQLPLNGYKSKEKWNQFEANKALFGVESTYDENIYTTRLIKGPHQRDLELHAATIAREIQAEQTADLHVAEERGLDLNTEIDEESRYSSVPRLQPVSAPAGRWVPPPHLLHPPLGSSENKSGSSSNSEPRRDSLLLQPAGGHLVEQRPFVVASRAPTHARWTAPANLPHHPSGSRSYYNGVAAAGGTAVGGSHDRSRRSQAGSRRRSRAGTERRAQDGVERLSAKDGGPPATDHNVINQRGRFHAGESSRHGEQRVFRKN